MKINLEQSVILLNDSSAINIYIRNEIKRDMMISKINGELLTL